MDTVAPKEANWFTYFPEDYRWSAAVCGIVATAGMGGSDIGEVDRAGRRLRTKLGDDDAWFEEWRRVADTVRELGEKAEASAHRFTAASAYLRSCCYYQWGERFRTPKDAAALSAYKTAVDCFHKFVQLTDRPRIEIVEVPYEGASLPGYFVHAENSTLERQPTMVFFDGLDITKELQFVPRRARTGASRDFVPGHGRSGHRRGDPLSRHALAARL